MSGSILRVQPSTKPLLYFWCVCDDAQPYKRDWRLSACQEIKKKHGSEIEAFRVPTIRRADKNQQLAYYNFCS